MDSIISPAIEILDAKKQNNSLTEQVLNIIHHEFDKDLSLDVCAARLNYNAQHISRVFHKEMDVGFSEYLMAYRLEIAKRWLRETDMKVSDISQRLQYSNSQNFIRLFKNVEGMTPNSYREHHKKMAK